MRHTPGHIDNPDAYQAGAERRIAANAHKTWLTLVPRAAEAKEFLETARLNDFLMKMRDSLETFGKLTQGQHAAVLRAIDQRKAERAQAREPAAVGQYVGALGVRMTLILTVRTMKRVDGDFGVRYFYLCETPEGATVVYAGSSYLAPTVGSTITLVATIREHGQRGGRARTVIQRPKLVANTPMKGTT